MIVCVCCLSCVFHSVSCNDQSSTVNNYSPENSINANLKCSKLCVLAWSIVDVLLVTMVEPIKDPLYNGQPFGIN